MPSYSGPPVAARPGEVSGTLRLLAYLALAITLLILDDRGGWLSQIRSQANVATQPLWWLAGLPGRLGHRVQDDAASHARLAEDNRNLRNELLIANARLTRLQTAAADNAQLRELMGMAEGRGLDVQLAPILNIDLDPTRQRLVLDLGTRDQVRMGQAVIDAGGLLGQIIGVTPSHATVLLLTDPDHAVPVMVSRNGVRLIVYGRGDHLTLSDVPLNTDVKEEDLLVTSGLGGRFPAGFPVGTVTALRADDSRAFLMGEVKPAARLDRGRDVLLLRSAPAGSRLPFAGTNAPAALPEAATAVTADGPASAGTQAGPPDSANGAPAPVPAAVPTPASAPAPLKPAAPAAVGETPTEPEQVP